MRRPEQTALLILALLTLVLFVALFIGYRAGADTALGDNAAEVAAHPSPS